MPKKPEKKVSKRTYKLHSPCMACWRRKAALKFCTECYNSIIQKNLSEDEVMRHYGPTDEQTMKNMIDQ